MPWLSFTIHKLPLWLPEVWVPIDDALLEIATTIEAHNRDREPDYPFRIKWSPWRVLMWLWRLEEVAVHGRLSYRDPGVQVIAAVKTERTIRAFSYDGDRMCHIPTGETWFGVEVIAAEFAASPQPPAVPASTTPIVHSSRRQTGRPSHKDRIISTFNTLSDDVVRNAVDLAALFDPVRDLIPESRNNRGLPQRGFGNKTLRRHLKSLFDARRRTKSGTKGK